MLTSDEQRRWHSFYAQIRDRIGNQNDVSPLKDLTWEEVHEMEKWAHLMKAAQVK